jgi:hypothetical protein
MHPSARAGHSSSTLAYSTALSCSTSQRANGTANLMFQQIDMCMLVYAIARGILNPGDMVQGSEFAGRLQLCTATFS